MAGNIFLALGSNKGDRLKYIAGAVTMINRSVNCKVVKASSIYETSPYGKTDQPGFLNCAIQIESDLAPADLLAFVKKVEFDLGRKNIGEKWGPREIDVDIIFYNDVIYRGDMMNIPHPESLKRDFVMVPILELAPEFVHPLLNIRMDEIDLSGIEKHIIRKLDSKIII